MTEEIASRLLGWKWISFVGVPVKGTEGYPSKMRVRRFCSPETLATKEWIEFLAEHDGRDADGTEPLDYCYCSSQGYECPPRIQILVSD